MVPPSVCGPPVASEIYLVGQAPGVHEVGIGHPFAWTAGRTLFRWFAGLGVTEETFRARVYMAAVIRCFPGKAPGGGADRVPSPDEVQRCGAWMRAEVAILAPTLVIAVGKLAIAQIRPCGRLEEVVGPLHRGELHGRPVDWVALPHPSGVSAWPKTEPGRTLLADALATLGRHESWRRTFPASP